MEAVQVHCAFIFTEEKQNKKRNFEINNKRILGIFYVIPFILITLTQVSCDKNKDNPLQPAPIDSLPLPTKDTISLIRKLEEVYQTTSYTGATKTFSFYYDNQKRITALGIKNYKTNFDTGTVHFFIQVVTRNLLW